MNLKKLQLNGKELLDPNAEYSGKQVIYLDFNGTNNVACDDAVLNISVNGIDGADSGLDQRINKRITALNSTSAGSGVYFTVTLTERTDYSTRHVDGTDSISARSINFTGMPETIHVDSKIENSVPLISSAPLFSQDESIGTAIHSFAGKHTGASSASDTLSAYAYVSGVPLITFHTWTQDGGVYLPNGTRSSITYNQYTPAENGQHSVTGCTATATAQVIYYWGYEQNIAGQSITIKSISFDSSDQYTSYSMGINIDGDAQANGFLSFTQLNEKLSDIKYQLDPDEIAALSFGVGVKLQSDYGVDGTGAAYDVSFMRSIGFTATLSAYEYDSNGLLISSLINLKQEITDNMQSGHPVLIAMEDVDYDYRHAVIIDGYNSGNDTFHFNMGWGGYDDGWYTLSNLPAGYDKIYWLLYDIYLPIQQVITIAAQDGTAGEPADNGTYRISRTGDTTSSLTVFFSVGGTATGGSDYTLKNGSTALTTSVIIAAGQSYVDITLAVIDDAIVESTETAIVNLTANAAYTLGATTSATINITDNDVVLPTVTIAVTDATAGEPADSGNYRISRTGATTNALTVNFSTGGTATGGSDYTLKNGSTALTTSVVIAAGQSYVDITLAVIDDAVVESTETAIVNLTANAAYTLGATTSSTINITDNDVALPTVTVAAADGTAG